MKTRFILAVVLAVSCASSLMAQGSGRNLWSGYMFLGRASEHHGYSGGADAGIGVEYIAAKGVGLGAEFGGISRVAVFSVDGVYRIPLNRRIRPFLTTGYSATFDSDGDNGSGFNIGGGIHYYLRKRLAIRAEARELIFPEPVFGNFPSFRIGITF
jgi:hypothetical protein